MPEESAFFSASAEKQIPRVARDDSETGLLRKCGDELGDVLHL